MRMDDIVANPQEKLLYHRKLRKLFRKSAASDSEFNCRAGNLA